MDVLVGRAEVVFLAGTASLVVLLAGTASLVVLACKAGDGIPCSQFSFSQDILRSAFLEIKHKLFLLLLMKVVNGSSVINSIITNRKIGKLHRGD